jgi:hypothetical protein
MNSRRASFMVLALALLASQAGHMLAYQARFGAGAQQAQSTGAHAYFPGMAKSGLGVLAMFVLCALLAIGVARIARGRGMVRAAAQPPSFVRLFAALFTLQLAVFAVQESVESMVGGAPPSPVTVLLLWGTLGQLPVAAVAALALRWLIVRFEAAVEDIRTLLGTVEIVSWPVSPAIAPVLIGVDEDRMLSLWWGSATHKRGPPSPSRFSSS